MGQVSLVIGVIVLAIGIILGIVDWKKRGSFAVWLTVIGVGFIIGGIVLSL